MAYVVASLVLYALGIALVMRGLGYVEGAEKEISGLDAFWIFGWPLWVPVGLALASLLIWGAGQGAWRFGRWFFIRRHWTPEQWAENERKQKAKEREKAKAAQRKASAEGLARTRAATTGTPANQPVRSAAVQVRPPRDADDFETVAAEWLRSQGFNAKRTPKGPDGGLDVVGSGVAGQCKFHPSSKVGSPDIQRLYGASQGHGKAVFFHYGPGYTDAAVTEARRLGVERWEFDADRRTFRQR